MKLKLFRSGVWNRTSVFMISQIMFKWLSVLIFCLLSITTWSSTPSAILYEDVVDELAVEEERKIGMMVCMIMRVQNHPLPAKERANLVLTRRPQLIQDRLKDLHEIVTYGEKVSTSQTSLFVFNFYSEGIRGYKFWQHDRGSDYNKDIGIHQDAHS